MRPICIALLVIGVLAPKALKAQAKLPPSPIKTIYVVPTSHYDLGFVEPPSAVRERAARHIDEVIRMASSDPDFRWTIESVWQLQEWLKRAQKPSSVLPKDKEKIIKLAALLRSGQIELSTSWGSMHTDFMGEEELNRLVYGYAELNRDYGIESDLAMMDDVPGHPTSVPSVLAGSGTKYLVCGANIFIGVATALAPGNVPFYWESPDGSRVLTWVSQSPRGGYTEAMTDFYLDPYSLDPYTDRRPYDMFNPAGTAAAKTPIEIMETGVTELLNRYNKGGYKYDAVMALYAHDFVEPSNVQNLERAVKMWNARHQEVHLRIATPSEFLHYIEGKYAAQLPTYRGEWSGLWSESKTQSPRISALARYGHDHVPAAQSLWSAITLTKKIPSPSGNARHLFDELFTYDEHSGAGNTGWPQLNSSEPLEKQNREYATLMQDARKGVDELLSDGLKVVAQPTRYQNIGTQNADSWLAVIYNSTSWDRDDVTRLPAPAEGVHIERIRDIAAGRDCTFDIDESGEAIFVARSVPPFGYRTYQITTAPGAGVSTLKASDGVEVRNDRFQVRVRPDGDLQSARDLRSDRELVSSSGELPFNELLRVEGATASRIVYPIPVKVSVERGAQMSRIVVRRERSLFPVTTYTIYDGISRVDIRNELDRSQMAFPGGFGNWNDSYYFAFPLNVSADGLKVKREGQRWFDTLPDDYLPGARRDSVTTQHSISMTDGTRSVTIAHRQAFYWIYPGYISTKMPAEGAAKDLPAMFTGKFPLPEATLYSRALRLGTQADTHDLGPINIPTVEPGIDGRYVFEYALAGGGVFDSARTREMGQDFNVPLIAQYVQVAPSETSRSFFSVDRPNVEIVVIKPATVSAVRGEVSATPLDPPVSKAFIVRLQEFTGQSTTVRLSLPVTARSASLVSLTEDKVIRQLSGGSQISIQLRPFECASIRFEVQ